MEEQLVTKDDWANSVEARSTIIRVYREFVVSGATNLDLSIPDQVKEFVETARAFSSLIAILP